MNNSPDLRLVHQHVLSCMTSQDDLPKEFPQHNASILLAGTVQYPDDYILSVMHTISQSINHSIVMHTARLTSAHMH